MDDSPEKLSTVLCPLTLSDDCRFVVACGVESDAVTDPVAQSYKEGAAVWVNIVIRLARALTPPNGRVLDLGAHVGGFVLAAGAVGYEAIGIEAAPRNAELLRLAVRANGFTRVHAVHAAVGDRDGTVEFYFNGPWGTAIAGEPGRQALAVPAVRVDDVLARFGWDRVDFIKLDVEGSEVRCIRGMSGLLAREDAPPIVFESNTYTLGLMGHTAAELKTELSRFGYQFYRVSADALIPAAIADTQNEVCEDYLAVKGDLPAALRTWPQPATAPTTEPGQKSWWRGVGRFLGLSARV